MRYRILVSLEVEAAHDRQAYENALKLSELLKTPMVRMAVATEGIRLSDGEESTVVHHPLPANAWGA